MLELFMLGNSRLVGVAALGALGFLAVEGVHLGADYMLNHDRFIKLKEQFAQASVKACGDNEVPSKRNEAIYARVHHDLSNFHKTVSWMPSGTAADLIETAIEKNVVLYPATFLERTFGFDKNVKGVLYNENDRGSVFVYGDLDRAQFKDIFNQMGQQPDQNGNFVVRYDALHDQYQFVHVPEGQTMVMLPNGIEHVDIKSDPCLSDGGLKGLAKQTVKDGAVKLFDRFKSRFHHQP
jgi:hypothetical protein